MVILVMLIASFTWVWLMIYSSNKKVTKFESLTYGCGLVALISGIYPYKNVIDLFIGAIWVWNLFETYKNFKTIRESKKAK